MRLIDKKQFCPSSKDLDNEKLKQLAKRLKADSEKETLTNILEWQEKNLQYWWERWSFDISLKILGLISWLIILVTIFPVLELTSFSKLTLHVLILIIIIFSITRGIIIFLYIFLLPYIYLSVNVSLYNPLLALILLPYTLFYVGCLGAFAIILVYLFLRYRVFFRGKPIKDKIFKFVELVNNTFFLSLEVGKILEYRLAICKDYARLTSALLFNIYPDSDLYFLRIPLHVAAGIKINNKIYVLDQRLPVLTIDKWLDKLKRKKAKIYILKVFRNSSGKPIVNFRKIKKFKGNSKQKQTMIYPVPQSDIERLTEEVAKTLELKQSSHNYKTDFNIVLSNYAIYYDNDEITNYSLIRTIKNKIEKELCGNVDKLLRIKINQNKKDFSVNLETLSGG